LEQAKENIKRIEERANEEEIKRQALKAAKKMKSFEEGNMNAFMESDHDEEDEEDEDAQKHRAWLKSMGFILFFSFFFSFFFFSNLIFFFFLFSLRIKMPRTMLGQNGTAG
jgi:hypothetical protein